MTKTVSTRLSEDEVRELERIARRERLDRSALIRKMLAEDIETYRLNEAIDAIREGRASVEEAANQADVSVWAMINHLQEKNVQPPAEAVDALDRELEESAR